MALTISSAESPTHGLHGKEVVDTGSISTVEEPSMRMAKAPDAGGSSALVRVGIDPHTWGNEHVSWQVRGDLEGSPVFTLDDVGEVDEWAAFQQYG